MSFGAVIGCQKMYRLSYMAYLHNLDAVCMCVCVCACYRLHVYVYCMCIGRGLSALLPVCMLACCCLCVHILYVCRHAPEFRGSDSFDSYTCQWPDPGDNPCCRHKADRKAPISPPDTGPVCRGRRGGGRQPAAILHNTLSSFHPTNT